MQESNEKTDKTEYIQIRNLYVTKAIDGKTKIQEVKWFFQGYMLISRGSQYKHNLLPLILIYFASLLISNYPTNTHYSFS